MVTESIKTDVDKEIIIEKNLGIVQGQSILYMFIFYCVSILIVGAMIFQFIMLKNIMAEEEILIEKVLAINEFMPYEYLIYSLILYGLGMFGIEGTRAVIKSFDMTSFAEKAKNMPVYKRNRLLQMIFTFIFISILGMIFQINSMDCLKASFHLETAFIGIGIFISLLAYSDMGPKLGKDIVNRIIEKNHSESKEKEEK